MNNRDLANAQPFGEVLGAPIEPGNTVDLGRRSAFAQLGGKSPLGVNSSTRAALASCERPNARAAPSDPATASAGMLYAAVASEPITESSYGLQRPHAKRAVDLFP
jgi:hypothetical protein